MCLFQGFATHLTAFSILRWLENLFYATWSSSLPRESITWLSQLGRVAPDLVPFVAVARRVLDWFHVVRNIPREKLTLPNVRSDLYSHGGLWFYFVARLPLEVPDKDRAELLIFHHKKAYDPVRSIQHCTWPVNDFGSDLSE